MPPPPRVVARESAHDVADPRVNKHITFFEQGETDMGDKGKKDKARRQQQKKAMLSPKEKRKLKKQKKNQ